MSHHTSLGYCGIVLMLLLWQTPWYTQDGPNHKKIAVILSRLATSPAEVAVYTPNLGLATTNTLFPLLYQPLARVVSPDGYERWFVGICLLLLLGAFQAFLRVWAPDHTALWVLGLPLCFHPLFLRGMYNYLASVPLTLIAFTLLRRGWQQPCGRRVVPFILCCWVAWLAHPFPFFALGVGWISMLMVEGKPRGGNALLFGTVIAAFLIGGFGGPLWQTPQTMQVPYRFANIPELLGGVFLLNFMDYSFLSLVCMLPFFGLLAWLAWRSMQDGVWPRQVYWLVLLGGYLLFPSSGNGGAHLNDRFLPFLWLFLPVGLPLLTARAVRTVQVVSLVTFVLAAGSMVWGMRTLVTKMLNAQHVLHALPSLARLYPINFDLKGPAVAYRNLNHIWAVYADEKVVFSPYLLAFPHLTPLLRKVPHTTTYFPATAEGLPEQTHAASFCKPLALEETLDCRARRTETWQGMLQKAMYYDYWFVSDAPGEFLAVLAAVPGLQQITAAGNFSLWHYSLAQGFQPDLFTP